MTSPSAVPPPTIADVPRTAQTLASPITGYEDWPAHAHSTPPLMAEDSAVRVLAEVLGIRATPATPAVTVHEVHESAGIRTSTLSWWVGFGPRTTAYLLEPADADGSLPGVLALHAHGGKRWIGAEQLVDLGDASSLEATLSRKGGYDGMAPANELARRGYAVLAHDAFSWGSRRFDLSHPTEKLAAQLDAFDALWRAQGIVPSEAERFNRASALHEETIAKAAGMLGQSFAGLVLFDDLVALSVLAALPSVDASRLGAFGLSGGGGRSLLLGALHGGIRSHVVTCMMATFASLMPHYVDTHSWLLNSPGLWQYADWPQLAAIGADRSLFVQYGRHDPLFPADGMAAAHDKLGELRGASARYTGTFYDAGHTFNRAMQSDAWDHFDATL